ncbi:MAG: DUF192 domain-containing protein [Actinomycetes bacterium]
MRSRLEGLPVLSHGPVEVAIASTRIARLRGLAGRGVIPLPGLGLLLPRTRSIHTFGMGFRLDLIWLDSDGRAVRIDIGVKPRRILFCLRARSVLELPAAGRDAPRDPVSVGYAPDGGPQPGPRQRLGGVNKWQRNSASQDQERSQPDSQ